MTTPFILTFDHAPPPPVTLGGDVFLGGFFDGFSGKRIRTEFTSGATNVLPGCPAENETPPGQSQTGF
jgi:hypothetical protein